MKKFIIVMLFALLALSCSANKAVPAVAGGTSEETNALAANGSLVIGRDGHSKTALAFNNPGNFIASAEYGVKFSAAVAFEISAWVKIDSLPQKSDKPSNLVGKFNEGHEDPLMPSVFSLAVLNGACGTELPTFAFFLTDGNSIFACEQAVLSKTPVNAGKWTFIEAKWDGRYLTLYQDGTAVAREEKISAALPYSQLPVYLGKSRVPFAIEGLSLNTEAL